jgi:4-hydroxy-2-oxoheptanedioate aldolase
MYENHLKEKMKEGPVYGIAIYSGSPAMVEVAGNFGLDFAFIDAEHTGFEVGSLKECILAARCSGISPLVRVTRPDEIQIRKALELGAEGVIIPHVRNRQDAELCVRGARFPQEGQPLWRRGYDSNVRSAAYSSGDFKGTDYIRHSNETELVIPMAEDYEFMDNIEEILSVPGLDAINFGPTDYAMSLCIQKFYDMNEPQVKKALDTLAQHTTSRQLGLMAPANPPTADGIRSLVERGVNMVILGNDMGFVNASLKNLMSQIEEVNRNR